LEGEALGIITATGDTTMLGKTARLALNTTVELTVLQKEIQQFVKRISTIGVIVLIISISTGVYWLDSIVFGVGSIVAIVPEGLQLTVTVLPFPLILTFESNQLPNSLISHFNNNSTVGSYINCCSYGRQ
jgi:sodium/potassium-transporting ATPase subunit alpha